LKHVTGKTTLLFQLAEAALQQPEGRVRDVLFPVVSEQTLKDLVREYKSTGPSYRRHVHTVMRNSYRAHYRRMVPPLLSALSFRSNNTSHRPVIQALDLVKQYTTSKLRYYPAAETVPLDGVIRSGGRELVVERAQDGTERLNRINYEIGVLQTLREKLRCKEIWVVGANRYRNPDEDLPADFDQERQRYYAALRLPRAADAFVTGLQEELTAELDALDRTLPGNTAVKIRRKPEGWIALSPLEALSEPVQLASLKGEIGHRWPLTSLLDILKETDLRVRFTDQFQSPTAWENLDRPTLQKRLLLCLYGLGTNTGLKRMSAGDHGESYKDLLYVRRRFLHREQLRAATRQVVNAILQTRLPQIWGEGTTACAADSKKFGVWDQNLMTEWHIRYRGPGIMVYWAQTQHCCGQPQSSR
jgi:Tn3 transposase DDE domain-containing protein